MFFAAPDPNFAFPTYPTIKIGDFGLAGITEAHSTQNPDDFRGRGTSGYHGTEQRESYSAVWNNPITTIVHDEPFTEKLNVWGIGLIMYMVLTLREIEFIVDTIDTVTEREYYDPRRNQHFLGDLTQDPRYAHFDPTILRLIRDCVHPDPRLRPSAQQVLLELRNGVVQCAAQNAQRGTSEPPVYFRQDQAQQNTYWSFPVDAAAVVSIPKRARPDFDVNTLQRVSRQINEAYQSLVFVRQRQPRSNPNNPLARRQNQRIEAAQRRYNQAMSLQHFLVQLQRNEDRQTEVSRDLGNSTETNRWYDNNRIVTDNAPQNTAVRNADHEPGNPRGDIPRYIPGSYNPPERDVDYNAPRDIEMYGGLRDCNFPPEDTMIDVVACDDYSKAPDGNDLESDPPLTPRARPFGNGFPEIPTRPPDLFESDEEDEEGDGDNYDDDGGRIYSPAHTDDSVRMSGRSSAHTGDTELLSE